MGQRSARPLLAHPSPLDCASVVMISANPWLGKADGLGIVGGLVGEREIWSIAKRISESARKESRALRLNGEDAEADWRRRFKD